MTSKDTKHAEYRATVSRDGFGSEYDDSDFDERDAAEEAYEQAARNVIKRLYPKAKIETEIDFQAVELYDSAVIVLDGVEDYDTKWLQGEIWDEMCGVTWSDAREAAGLE